MTNKGPHIKESIQSAIHMAVVVLIPLIYTATHKGKKVNTSLTCNAVVSDSLIWKRDKIHETELNSFPRAEGQIE